MTTWSTGNNLGTARSGGPAGCGSSAATLVSGGGSYLATSEEMNSLTWSAGGSLAIGRVEFGGFGTQSAGAAVAGISGASAYTNDTSLYNGTSWASSGAIAYQLGLGTATGSQSAGMYCGGTSNSAGSGATNYTATFNGATWSASGNLGSSYYGLASGGSQSAAFSFGGQNGANAFQDVSQNFNGATWASSGTLPATRANVRGFGTQSAGRCYGGITSSYTYANSTYLYNGATWSTGNSLNTARSSASGGCEVAAGGGNAASSVEIYGDNAPGAFSFVDVVDVNLSTLTWSNTITPTGYDVTVAWTCTGGEASVNNGAWATSGTINPGETVQLRATSSSTYATAVSATLTIGGVSDVWYVITRNAPIPQIIFL